MTTSQDSDRIEEAVRKATESACWPCCCLHCTDNLMKLRHHLGLRLSSACGKEELDHTSTLFCCKFFCFLPCQFHVLQVVLDSVASFSRLISSSSVYAELPVDSLVRNSCLLCTCIGQFSLHSVIIYSNFFNPVHFSISLLLRFFQVMPTIFLSNNPLDQK